MVIVATAMNARIGSHTSRAEANGASAPEKMRSRKAMEAAFEATDK